jgi:hypothetical protein
MHVKKIVGTLVVCAICCAVSLGGEPVEKPPASGHRPDPSHASGPWQHARRIADFDRFDLTPADATYAVRKRNELKVEGKAVSGAVECDFEVPETGWYELLVEPEGGLNEFVIDGQRSLFAGAQRKANAQDQYGKVDNLWLAKGRHTLRVQRRIWWGFWPPTKSIAVRRTAESSIGKTVRVECSQGPGEILVRRGESLGLTVCSGGRTQPGVLKLQLVEKSSGRVEVTVPVPVVAGPDLVTTPVSVPCQSAGVFEVRYLDGDTPINTVDLASLTVQVIDTTPVSRPGGELAKTLLQEIDCAAKEPDYVSGGPTQVVAKPLGKYRLSGDVGFLHAQHHGLAESWFAYRIETPDVGRPHILEVDYPDDDLRTFLIVVRESSPDDYPLAGGVDSGGCWSLSDAMQTQTLLFWPKTKEPRVAFLAAHNGRRAAAAKIRVYRVEGEIPPLDVPVSGGRTFVNWYEEGSNFAGFYGGTKGDLAALRKPAEMWPRELCYMGGNLLIPTVSVYQMNLYPSRFNHFFAEPTTTDVVRLLLLNCEKYGVRLAAEFHPEARELEDPRVPRPQRENGLASKTGQVCGYDTHGPMHHPLDAQNQQWYLGMIGELAERYKDSPAFAGVSLRCMSWANPALNNFHSLDWGYDDQTIGQFERETGTDVAVDPSAADRFSKRYDWLMARAKDAWIAWRCEKIAEYHRRIVDRVRQARKDLCVYLTVFDLGPEAGLDPQRLAAIDGVVLINSRHAYGRQASTYQGFFADQAERDKLLDPAVLHQLASPAAFLFGARYFEATERVLKTTDLGLAADGKPKWISGVVNPAGRHYLERFAVALAETDASMLGDGGNAYTLGQPLLREFLSEFRRLPAVSFTARRDARDPVAVWELTREQDFLFYAVNRERYPTQVAISLATDGPVQRLATGQPVSLAEGQLKLDLQPYQLLAFQAPARTRIARVATMIPAADRAHVEAMVQCVESLAKDAGAGKFQLDAAARQLLAATLDEARRSLREGNYWRARTMLENQQLARLVYNPALTFPPGLDYLMEPRTRRLLAARSLPKPKEPLIHISFDRIDERVLPVTGKLNLQATVDGACELRDGRRGKAVHLDGKSSRVVVQGPDRDALNLRDFTLSVWVNAESVTERKGIVLKQKWPAGYALLFWNGSVLAEVGGPDGNSTARTGDSLCRAGVWHHVAATVQSGKTITLFVDGEEVKKADLKQTVGATTEPLVIGWNSWGGRQNDQSPGLFSGLMDDLKIWDRPLTAEEVLAEMAGDE